MKKILVLLASVAALPLVSFAISGKTMFHYVENKAAFWPKNDPPTQERFEARYLNGLGGLPFDTLVFAPSFSFGMIEGKLSSASYPKHQPQAGSAWMASYRNALPEFLQKGLDPIAMTIKWCRNHKKEAVIALPINHANVHSTREPDAKNPANGWYSYFCSDFLKANPDCCMETAKGGAAAYARFYWGTGKNMADYTSAKVRDKYLAIAKEIAGKYDMDGIMVDFMMNPVLFKSVASGGTAAPKELTLITDMMIQIKAAVKAAEARLGHKVALSVRVPDSVAYCKDIGIDLQGWLDQKIPDYVVLGGLFQLNRWNVTGDIVAKAGIPWYASFTQSGITVCNDSGYSGDDERLIRNGQDACRARMADVLLCKGTGIMFTMGQDFDVQMQPSVCVPYDAKTNRTGNKRYFVSFTNDRIAGNALKDGTKHRSQPSLISNERVDLSKGMQKYAICVWDDFAALKKDGIVPKTILATECELPSGIEAIVTFNGKEVKCFKKRAGVQYYELPPGVCKTGSNEVTIKAKGRNKRGDTPYLGNIAVEVTFDKKGAK